MLMQVIKQFTYSTNGVDSLVAEAGTQVELPDDLVAGLMAEDFIRRISQPDEYRDDKALFSVPENKLESSSRLTRAQRRSQKRAAMGDALTDEISHD